MLSSFRCRFRASALGLLSILLPCSSARAEFRYPTLVSFTRDGDEEVSLGGKLRFKFHVTPGDAPVGNITVIVTSAAGADETICRAFTTTDIASGILETTIDRTWVNGRYIVSSVEVEDTWNRAVTYDGNGVTATQKSWNPGVVYNGPSVHSLGLCNLDFTIAGASGPLGMPIISVAAPVETSLSPGKSARIPYTITPSTVKTTKATFTIESYTGAVVMCVTVDDPPLSGEVVIPITTAMADGIYHVGSATVSDAYGRSFLFGSPIVAFATVDGVTYSVNLPWLVGRVPFSVVNAGASNPCPTLTSWTSSAQHELKAGETISWTYQTAPGFAPVQELSVTIGGPCGAAQILKATGTSGTITFRVPADAITGSYAIRLITVTDTSGRSVNYTPTGALNSQWGGTYTPLDRQATVGSVQDYLFTVAGREVAPYFSEQPASATYIEAGQAVELSARAVAQTPDVEIRWFAGEPGDTSRPLASASATKGENLSHRSALNVSPSVTQTYWAQATAAGHVVVSNPARVVVLPMKPPPAAQLSNLSIRTAVGAGNATVIVGFGVTGLPAKRLFVRGLGGALRNLDVSSAIADPAIEVFDATGKVVAQSDNNVGTLPDVGLAPAPYDAATVANLPPGTYSTQLHSRGGSSGVALAEIYDVDNSGGLQSQLTNLSARAVAGSGDASLIAGFSVAGSGTCRLLIRAIGPTLSSFGVDGVLSDPVMTVAKLGATTPLLTNDDWEIGGPSASVFAQVGAFPLPAGSRDAAATVSVGAGSYTVMVSGKNGATGVALIEVYLLP